MTRLRLTFILISSLVLSSHSLAKWSNPVDKYSEVYKQYLTAKCPISANNIKHFVYFARDREQIIAHPFLENKHFVGAQIMYSWAQLEVEKDNYDFSIIENDRLYLESQGKKLFVQLQDATFNPKYKGVPSYLLTEEYAEGTILQRTDDGEPEGWVAKRWNKNVQKRFARLLNALGQKFDGKIEGINLQESAIGVSQQYDENFTPALYSASLKSNMLALKSAFPISVTMQYANFMPGEWLPWEDEGYLKSIYQYGKEIGVGLGAPDLMVQRRGQLNHAISMMHESSYQVPLGIAIQDGNYIGQTNSDKVVEERKNIVPLLHDFAKDFIKVDYMFWVNQEPYFEKDVLSCFSQD